MTKAEGIEVAALMKQYREAVDTQDWDAAYLVAEKIETFWGQQMEWISSCDGT